MARVGFADGPGKEEKPEGWERRRLLGGMGGCEASSFGPTPRSGGGGQGRTGGCAKV